MLKKSVCEFCDCSDEPVSNKFLDLVNESTKPFVYITDWRVVDWPDCTKRLTGIPTNHPNTDHVSGIHPVVTSEIVEMNTDENWVETKNTNYILIGERLGA